MKNPTLKNITDYKQFRNSFTSIKRKAGKSHYTNKFNNANNNIKEKWKVINETLNRNNSRTSIDKIIFNNQTIENKAEICNLFNNHFIAMTSNTSNDVSNNHNLDVYLNNSPTNSIFFENATQLEILSVTQKLRNKSSTSDDNLSMYIIKKLISFLLVPLNHIFNLSLNLGIFPHQFKLSKIIPVFKKGKNDDINNYRPISLLSPISKILEKLIFNRLSLFIEKNSILHKNQFGFRTSHSTELAITDFTQQIMHDMNDKQMTLGLFLDLSKAYDVINHELLLKKLDHYGIRGIANSWFKSYLSSRKQYVSIENFSSNLADVVNGVPQGSILGPILFLLFINDLCTLSSKIKCILFADDTNLFYSSNNLKDCTDLLNQELNIYSSWFTSNKLKINYTKCSYMIFGPKILTNSITDLPIKLNNTLISRTEKTKFLGLIITENFSWNEHLNYLSLKVNKLIGLFHKIKNKLPYSTLISLYYTFIYPNLTYGITLWGNSPKSHLNNIILSQKRAVRLICNLKLFESTQASFSKLKIMKIKIIYIYFTSIFVFKFIQNLLPISFKNFYIFSNSVQTTSTRHTTTFYTYKTRLKLISMSLKHTGPKIWTILPDSLKSINRLQVFKKSLKHFLNEHNDLNFQ